MVLQAIALLFGSLILFLGVGMIVIARTMLSEVPEDTILSASPRRGRSIFARFWNWLNTSPPLLDYRRDKRGRFRKVRRG